MKIRMARPLIAGAQGDALVVGSGSQAARITRIHQLGLRDRVERDGPLVKYGHLTLLGLTHSDLATIRDSLLTHLTPVRV